MPLNVLEELETFRVNVSDISGDHAKVNCPFHDDTRASMSIRITGEPLGHAKCFGCGQSSAFVFYLQKLYENDGKRTGSKKPVPTAAQILGYLENKWGLVKQSQALDPKLIDQYSLAFTEDNPFRKELFKRYVDADKIRQFKLGYDNKRITIPVKDEYGNWVNVLRYLPNAKDNKFVSMGSGRGKTRMFPYDQFSYEKLILTAGPIKAIAGTRLNEYGYGCVTVLGGENTWDQSFNKLFTGKKVWIVYDADKAGFDNSTRICVHLYAEAAEVHRVILDFEVPKGGLDDYLFLRGPDRLIKLMEKTDVYRPPTEIVLDDADPIPVTLSQAYRADNIAKRLSIPVRVSGVCTTPYPVPKNFSVTCTKDAKPNGICTLCPVYQSKDPEYKKVLRPESASILLTVDKSNAKLNDALLRETGIPGSCNKHSFKVEDYQIVEDIRVSPLLDLSDTEREREDLPAICAEPVEANSLYEVTGRLYPHPDTQKATLVLGKAKPLSDDITGWINDQDLSVFRPHEVSVEEQYRQILLYWERNVTHIYQRWEMHALMDLVYHTPLTFSFEGKSQPGWGQCLIVGDASQGKSLCFDYMRNYLQLGVKVDSKNLTTAGLLGGCTTMDSTSKKMFIKWGILPNNDRKLVGFEEIGGCALEILGKITETRSSGIAQLPKIENKSTKARTRGIYFGNPRTGRPLSAYTYGVEPIYEIFGTSADLRRFDIVLAVDAASCKRFPDPNETLKFEATQEQFRAACLFAWTRQENQIVFEDEKYISKEADRLASEYIEDRMPLLNAGGARYKLAKLSAALAIRLFSSPDGQTVLVKNEHVDYVLKLFRHIYEGNATGFKRYSDAMRAMETIHHPEFVEKALKRLPFGKYLVERFMTNTFIERIDVQDTAGIDRNETDEIIGTLIRCRCIIRKGRAYVKTPGFVEFLKGLDWQSWGEGPTEEKKDQF